MDGKAFKIWLCAVVFAVIQMTADCIKAIYQEHYLMLVMEGLMLVWMCWLGKWAFRQHKRRKANE